MTSHVVELNAASDVDPRIAHYRDKWAVVNAGGKVLFFNTKETDLSRALLAEPDFKRLHRHDYAIGEDLRGQEKTTYWADEFAKRPPKGTKFYANGFRFKPGGNADPESFNLYRGLHADACPSGSCELFRELIFNVWASGNQELGEWLWEYLLHMVARPGERVRTSIAIRGSQGAGKSIVFEMMRRIFADMLLIIDNQNMILGAFNESLVGKLGAVLEEAAFAGDRGAFQKMKNLITGDTVHINPKHKAPITVENFARVFIISNDEHFVHLEPGDRRYTVIEVSDAWKNTNKYVALLEQWADGGAERFAWEAVNHEFRLIPGSQTLVINKKFQTKYAAAQVAQSRDPLQQALVDLLLRGVFASMRYGTEIVSANQFYWRMEEEAEIELVLLQTHLRAVMKTLAPHRAEHFTSLRRIIRELELFCGKTEERKSKRKDVTGRWVSVPTCRVLPSRRDALDHALAKGLITEEEYNAAVVRPDEYCSAHSRGGPIFGLRGMNSEAAPNGGSTQFQASPVRTFPTLPTFPTTG